MNRSGIFFVSGKQDTHAMARTGYAESTPLTPIEFQTAAKMSEILPALSRNRTRTTLARRLLNNH